MAKIIAIEHLTLDGVMQSPGHPDEDPRDGFTHGGWAAARGADPKLQQAIGARMGDPWSLLVGRTTYVRFADFWPKQAPNPMTDSLNRVRKYVISKTLREPLPWQNSSVLPDLDAVARLRTEVDHNLVIFGSGVLVRGLMARDLIDEFVLQFHPLILGTGRRLFAESGALSELELVESLSTETGVIVATYRAVVKT